MTFSSARIASGSRLGNIADKSTTRILIGSISEFAPGWAKAGSGLSTDIGIDPLPPLRLPRRSQGLRLWSLDVRILNN
jgi:hypothetical protein